MKTVEITYRYGAPSAALPTRPADADAARTRLSDGNRAFAGLMHAADGEGGTASCIIEVDPRDLGLELHGHEVPKQHPFAAVLGCSDARVPIELIFNEGPNDLFVVRIAGNGLGNDALGSLRFAIEHLRESLRLIVVLGHSGCGAVSAAVDAFLEPAGYVPLTTNHALRTILDRQFMVVEQVSRKLARMFGERVTEHARYREALIECSVAANAALTAYTVQQELRGQDTHALRTVYGVYRLDTREVWAPRTGTSDTAGLAEPPANPVDFIELGDAIAGSERISEMLA
ncbi:MAG TPA: carbonic anhydrase [Acidisphaera sp.]|nr:carbonic anhydrase [Acidisphaera sp.]